jgi:hypothetical protein
MITLTVMAAGLLAYVVGKPITERADLIDARKQAGIDQAVARLKSGNLPPAKALGGGKFVGVTLPLFDQPVLVTPEEYRFLDGVTDWASDEAMAVIRHILQDQTNRGGR